MSANIDERTQHEMYYPAFHAAIRAGVASVMCSYNKINNVYACENNDTLTNGLKNEMGFDGFVSAPNSLSIHPSIDESIYIYISLSLYEFISHL